MSSGGTGGRGSPAVPRDPGDTAQTSGPPQDWLLCFVPDTAPALPQSWELASQPHLRPGFHEGKLGWASGEVQASGRV